MLLKLVYILAALTGLLYGSPAQQLCAVAVVLGLITQRAATSDTAASARSILTAFRRGSRRPDDQLVAPLASASRTS